MYVFRGQLSLRAPFQNRVILFKPWNANMPHQVPVCCKQPSRESDFRALRLAPSQPQFRGRWHRRWTDSLRGSRPQHEGGGLEPGSLLQNPLSSGPVLAGEQPCRDGWASVRQVPCSPHMRRGAAGLPWSRLGIHVSPLLVLSISPRLLPHKCLTTHLMHPQD